MNTQTQIDVFQGQDLNFIESNGTILFTAEEVGKHLGYSDPTKAMHRLFQRNRNELKVYSVGVKVTSTDKKQYLTRAFTEEGVYILSMLARTSRAKKFRASVAQLLRRIRKQHLEQAIELAQQSGFEQGIDHARGLPAVQVMQKQAYLDGLKEGIGNAEALRAAPEALLQLQPKRLQVLQQALRYARVGLSVREITKIIDGDHRQIGNMLSLARKHGLLPPYMRGKKPSASVSALGIPQGAIA